MEFLNSIFLTLTGRNFGKQFASFLLLWNDSLELAKQRTAGATRCSGIWSVSEICAVDVLNKKLLTWPSWETASSWEVASSWEATSLASDKLLFNFIFNSSFGYLVVHFAYLGSRSRLRIFRLIAYCATCSSYITLALNLTLDSSRTQTLAIHFFGRSK